MVIFILLYISLLAASPQNNKHKAAGHKTQNTTRNAWTIFILICLHALQIYKRLKWAKRRRERERERMCVCCMYHKKRTTEYRLLTLLNNLLLYSFRFFLIILLYLFFILGTIKVLNRNKGGASWSLFLVLTFILNSLLNNEREIPSLD